MFSIINKYIHPTAKVEELPKQEKQKPKTQVYSLGLKCILSLGGILAIATLTYYSGMLYSRISPLPAKNPQDPEVAEDHNSSLGEATTIPVIEGASVAGNNIGRAQTIPVSESASQTFEEQISLLYTNVIVRTCQKEINPHSNPYSKEYQYAETLKPVICGSLVSSSSCKEEDNYFRCTAILNEKNLLKPGIPQLKDDGMWLFQKISRECKIDDNLLNKLWSRIRSTKTFLSQIQYGQQGASLNSIRYSEADPTSFTY